MFAPKNPSSAEIHQAKVNNLQLLARFHYIHVMIVIVPIVLLASH